MFASKIANARNEIFANFIPRGFVGNFGGIDVYGRAF